MCFDQRTSGFFALVGFVLSVWVYHRTHNVMITSGVFFFFAMELLQVVQYSFIDDCKNPINRYLTLVGYAHICLQPYFTHVLSMSLVKSKRVLAMFSAVRKLCLMGGFLMFTRYLTSDMAKLPPSEECPSYEWIRGNDLCTYSGKHHLAWTIPMNDPTYYTVGIGIHSFLMFTPFFIVWRPTMWAQGLLLFLTGPGMAAMITENLHEQASIWCFFSIAQIAVMLFFIRGHMTRERSAFVKEAHAMVRKGKITHTH